MLNSVWGLDTIGRGELEPSSWGSRRWAALGRKLSQCSGPVMRDSPDHPKSSQRGIVWGCSCSAHHLLCEQGLGLAAKELTFPHESGAINTRTLVYLSERAGCSVIQTSPAELCLGRARTFLCASSHVPAGPGCSPSPSSKRCQGVPLPHAHCSPPAPRSR